MSIRITTYNILSPELCNPETYPTADPVDLDAENRKVKIILYLNYAMTCNDVICLQEVSMSWTTNLQLMFERARWSYTWFAYGYKHQGNMGSALAINMSSSSNVTVGDIKISIPSYLPVKFPSDHPRPSGPSFLERAWTFSSKFMLIEKLISKSKDWLIEDAPPKKYHPFWGSIKARGNAVIMAKLTLKDSYERFIVATYHSPCVFGSRENDRKMCIFARLAVESVYEYAGKREVIFAGDFNIRPDSPAYSLLTTGNVGEVENVKEFVELSDTTPDDYEEHISNQRLLRDIFAEGERGFCKEYYTVCSKSRSNCFKGVLDYIFVSDMWETVELKEPASYLGEHQPNRCEPSDHLSISAVLKMKPRVNVEVEV